MAFKILCKNKLRRGINWIYYEEGTYNIKWHLTSVLTEVFSSEKIWVRYSEPVKTCYRMESILKNINIVPNGRGDLFVKGYIFNDKRFNDNEFVQTSHVVKIDIENKTLQTKNTLYRLGDLED